MAQQTYDLLVIGAGAAGSTAATTAAQQGARVALVECDKIGGTCLNYGCDPTKTMIHTARLLYHARHSEQFGLRIDPDARGYDWPDVMQYVHETINRIRGGTSPEAASDLSQKGIEVYTARAVFTSPHDLSLDGTPVSAERIIIATGGQNVIPPVEGLNKTGYITNVQAVNLQTLPRRLAVIGGGAIGMEFAQMFHRFGVEVTVLERSPMLLDKEDRELADKLCDLLRKEGLRLETNAELRRVQRNAQGIVLTIHYSEQSERGEEQLVVDEILMAVGRRPSFEALHLENAGVQTTKKGIEVDATLRTNVPHIWAAGDVNGSLQFTHVAYEQGKLAAQNAFSRIPQPFEKVIPWVTFTDPALAHVGKTEEQLKEAQIEYRTGCMLFQDVERAVAEGATHGLVKLLVDEHGLLLGGHILAPHAGDLLAPVILAMQAHLPAEILAATIQPYPTLVEGVRWAANNV
jgi:pyruvate/2-oxoglutarate dehydrogenase complex dihydrolipoamide dehydrogenase (E3) component